MTDYLEGYGEGYFDDYFEDYSHDEMEEYCPDEYADHGYRGGLDPEERANMDERMERDEGWITPFEASVLSYGFGLEEGMDERRRRRRLRQEARLRRLRRYRRGQY